MGGQKDFRVDYLSREKEEPFFITDVTDRTITLVNEKGVILSLKCRLPRKITSTSNGTKMTITKRKFIVKDNTKPEDQSSSFQQDINNTEGEGNA